MILSALLLFFGKTLAAPQPRAGQSSLTPRQTVAHPVLHDCPTWNSMPFDPNTCVVYKEIKEGGAVAQVYGEVATHGTDVDATTKSRLGSLKKTIADVLSFYARNLDKKVNVRLTIVRTDRSFPGDPDGMTTANPNTGTPCQVAIWIKPSRSNKLLAHTVAHELYHCVQRISKPQPEHGWVEDGSATFMEYFQYVWDPTKEQDGIAPHHYNPSKPLYDPENQYTSSLFFMFRHNLKFTVRDIDKWVQGRVDTPVDNELAALAQDQPLASAFARFAVKFHNNGIRYDSAKGSKSKMLVTSNDVAVAADKTFDLPAEGTTDEQVVEMDSWMFQKYKIHLIPGQTVSATIAWTHASGQPEPTVVIWRRAVRQGRSPTAWSKFRPGLLQSGCSKTATTYEFLVVPITKEESVVGDLRFTRQRNAKCACPVKGPVSNPTKRTAPSYDLETRQEGNSTNSSPSGTVTPVSSATHFTIAEPRSQPTLVPIIPPVEPSDGQDWPEGETDDGWRNTDPGSGENGEEPAEEIDIDETGNTNEEDPSCDEPPVSGPSCLIGTWRAIKASMDAHFVKPEFAYRPHEEINSTFSGSLTFTFGQDPSASDTLMMLPISDKLLEEQLLVVKSTTTGPPEITWFFAITSILEGFAAVSVSGGFRPLGPEIGMIARNITGSSGVAEVSSGRGQTPSVSASDGRRTRPQGIIFDYNCTASTLYYNARSSSVKSYVFDRV